MQLKYFVNDRKKLKGLLVVVLLLVVVFIGYQVYISQTRKDKIAVEVLVLPKDATIYANDTRIKNGTAYLRAGTYKVVVTKEGFATSTEQFSIDEDRRFIQVALTAESKEAREWRDKHQKELAAFESKVGEAANIEGEALKKRHPITRILPKQNLVYKIGYTTSQDNNFLTLTIHAITPQQRQAALQQIRDWGYDPTDYKISFADYINLLQTDSERDEHEDE
jgi:hypothetical protein